MQKPTGAIPLFALNAVALDLETTSLNVNEARIVQIGALQMDAGQINVSKPLDRIVDPHAPVPERSTAVHGITDAAARQAPDLAALWPELNGFLSNRVLIGHMLAYDLTILEREAGRYHLDWIRPRSLCIHLLAPLVIPELRDPSLDKLAAWFDIEIEGRHSALGDARAAAQIFLWMVPLLAERGIRTLAQAERASLRSAPQLRQMSESNWVAPIVGPAGDGITGDIKNFDTHAYRHTVGDAMTRRVAIVKTDATLKDAIATMASRAISSVLVGERPEPGQPIAAYGILTEHDVLRQIIEHGESALSLNASTIASSPISAIRETTFVYRAIARMRRLRFRRLAVVSDTGDLTGIISARDLLKLRTDPAIVLDDAIEEAKTTSDIAVAWASLLTVVQSLVDEGLDAHVVTRIISEELRVATERAAILSAESMIEEGLGPCPCPYAVVVLGSGGRGESLLKPDQDNAIVFEHGIPDGPEDRWFAELGNRMATILDQAGIPYCDGGVMAKNPQWRGSVATWQGRVDNWIASASPRNFLNVDIFFDQIPVHGDRRLGIDLFTYSYAEGSKNPVFAKFLGAELDHISNPFGFLGRIRTDRGKLDLKLHALFPVVAAARTLSIRHNILARSTKDRLNGLAILAGGNAGLILDLVRDHEYCLSLMLANQARDIHSGESASNFVDIAGLARKELSRLKAALGRIQLIPDLVRDLMY